MYSGENFDKRTFSGAVFSHQRVYFSAAQREIDMLKRFYARKCYGNIFHRKHNIAVHSSSAVAIRLLEKLAFSDFFEISTN